MALIPENSDDFIALESMVDKHGLHNVLACLQDICGAKAEHVQSNWQDSDLAASWNKNAALIDKARSKLCATE